MQPKLKPSPSNTPNIELQARDLDILKGLFESRLATLAQLAELHFDGKKEAAQNRVKKLKDAGFLKERPRASVGAPSIVHLSRRGFDTLTERGLLARYPRFIWSNLEDRAKVSPITLKHELNVMNIKATFARELRGWDDLVLGDFCTWPMLYEFKAKTHDQDPEPIKIKPDGFFSLRMPAAQHLFFLEVDRGSETLDTVVRKCFGYHEFFRTGGMARRFGKSDPKDVPFRVIVSVESEARRNNVAEALLRMRNPLLRLVWITTRAQIEADPFAPIYLTPLAYRQAVEGSAHEIERVRPEELKQARKTRDGLVAVRAALQALF